MADLVVVGGGPGGVGAAMQAAAAGAQVVMAERAAVGGTCVHAGCIPAGALRRVADVYRQLSGAARLGIDAGDHSLSWPGVHTWVASVVKETAARVTAALSFTGVEVLAASAAFDGDGSLLAGDHRYEGIPVIVATGARDVAPDLAGEHGIDLLVNEGAMAVGDTPQSLVVLGAERFGLEWADLFASLGTRVTVVARDEQILSGEDADLTSFLQLVLEERGVRFLLGAEVDEVDGSTVVTGSERLAADAVLSADERRPNTAGLGLEAAGVALGTGGEITVDASCRTSVDEIFAVGDVTGPPWLSNRAAAQGTVAAVNALGGSVRFRPERLPRAVNTTPELAAVGLTEAEAAARGIEVAVGFADLAESARAIALGDPRGGLKLVVDAEFGEILGAHMVGTGAGETIAQIVAAIEAEVDYRDLAKVHHLHPTMAEVVAGAAAAIA